MEPVRGKPMSSAMLEDLYAWGVIRSQGVITGALEAALYKDLHMARALPWCHKP